MANYQPSILLDAVGIITDPFNKHEFRPGYFGATEAFMKYRDFSVPDLAEIRKSPLRATTARYLTRTNQSAVTARGCAVTASLGDSATETITWATRGFTVMTSAKQFDNNYYSQAKAFANDLYNGMLNAHEDIETLAVAYLEANKTGVNNGSAFMGTWDGVNDIFDIAVADKTRYYNYLKTIMRENKYRGELNIIQNVAASAIMWEQMAQGISNDTNEQYQYRGLNFIESDTVTAASDYLINSYVVPDHAISLLDWIPPLNVRGAKEGAYEWTTMGDLFGLPITWSVYKITSCADTTGTGGDTQDLVTKYEVTCDFGFVKAPITTASETAIYKFGLKTT